ncbi:sporulation stage III protein AG [Tissierella sp. Yu-01]|uniref:sporulation stage III protein AG n=1 Tax=Tissierella sp. Yu-01 TaxID=3035694 RepID=UPI00240DA2C5|nr:sporulation stage III protein AG [Tissierella sp. Yu-01]WFA09694.1 sporulation stage III protein AG [Tissierella sp. Yu-01]
MEEMINKIKKHLEEIGNKKFINNLFIILLVSIIVLIGVSIFTKDSEKAEIPVRVVEEKPQPTGDHSQYLEEKLASILEKLKGVGEVDVMITLEESIESVPASNTTKTTETTKEVDAEGGTREVNREDTNIQLLSSDDDGSLVVIKNVNPNVKGVIVVAEGAENLEVLEKIYEAVKTVLGISGNKVQVFSSK